MGELRRFLASRLVGVCAGYRGPSLVAAVASVVLGDDDGLKLVFPKRNPFHVGDAITVHLDDRVGSELYSVELRVHRVSYKGRVVWSEGREARVEAVAFDLYYGSRVVAKFQEPGYLYPADTRAEVVLDPSPLRGLVLPDDHEKSNKLGVLMTRSQDRPHTTVMAFLSSVEDDIFLITSKETFKYHNLARNPECAFALDHRATFSFETQVDWNYTIYETRAHRIDRSRPEFGKIQAEFIDKNPWEIAFFSNPLVEMIHLVPRRIVHQDILCD